jgi:hypothetical protein
MAILKRKISGVTILSIIFGYIALINLIHGLATLYFSLLPTCTEAGNIKEGGFKITLNSAFKLFYEANVEYCPSANLSYFTYSYAEIFFSFLAIFIFGWLTMACILALLKYKHFKFHLIWSLKFFLVSVISSDFILLFIHNNSLSATDLLSFSFFVGISIYLVHTGIILWVVLRTINYLKTLPFP